MSFLKDRPRVFVSLQAGRGIAALMVVLFHCNDILSEAKYWGHSWRLYLMFAHSGVQFFFVLSGIVIVYAHWNDIGDRKKLGSYAWKRIKRIYPIYWIVMMPVGLIYYCIPSFRRGFETEPMAIIQSLLLIHMTSTDTILGVAWTLFHEIMFYVIFALTVVNRKIGSIALFIWLSGSVYALVYPPTNIVLAAYLYPDHLLFGFGICVIVIVRRSSFDGLLLALFGAAGFISCSVYENIAGVGSYYLDTLYGMSAAVLLCGCMLMEQHGRLAVPKFMKLLGDASYSIYLVHFVVLSALAKMIYPVWMRLQTPLIVPYLLMTVASVATGICVHLFVERPLLRKLSKPKQNAMVGNEAHL